MKTIWIFLLICTPQCNNQIANLSNQLREESDALFEVTGYPLLGDIPILNRKIFRGARVCIREHPYVVSVRKRNSHFLTGALITKNIVLTIAHPLISVPVHELRIVVGESYADRGTSLLTVLLIIVHESFNPQTLSADLAMIRFYEDAMYKPSTKSIAITTPKMYLMDTTGYVTGWGRCDLTEKDICLPRSSQFFPDEKVDPMLRTVPVNIQLPNIYCQSYHKHQVKIDAGMLCIGAAREENPVTACSAVPGAPLVIREKLAGILSWGFGCGYADDLPLVYTNMKFYAKWIATNVLNFRHITKDDLSPLFQATRAYVLLNWLSNTRVLKPALHSHEMNKNIQKLNLDLKLASLQGDLIDIRDYIYDAEFRSNKKLMYNELRNIRNKTQKTNGNQIKIIMLKSYPFLSKLSLSDDGK